MRRLSQFVTIPALVVLIPAAAVACSGEIDQTNQRARIGADCSYHAVGQYNDNLGGAAQDIGNGIVIQRLARQMACVDTEDLLVIDCAAEAAIVVNGLSTWEVCDAMIEAGTATECGGAAGYIYSTLEYALTPVGPLDIVPGDNLGEIQAKARAAEVRFGVVQDFFIGDVWWDRYDMRCGCQLFYPDSAGATQ